MGAAMSSELIRLAQTSPAAGAIGDGCLVTTDSGATKSPSTSPRLEYIRCLLDKGHTALAIVLLQQVVADDPSNHEASSLLEVHLDKVASRPPVPVAQPAIGIGIIGWLAAELGHDSNINRATSAKVIDIPLLNYRSLSLPDLLVEKRSSFAGLQGGAAVRLPLTPGLRAIIHGQAGIRANFAEVSYLPHNYFLGAQLEHDIGRTTVAIGGSASQQWLAKYPLLERSAVRIQATTKPTVDYEVGIAADSAWNIYPQFDKLNTREHSIELRAAYRPFGLQIGAYWGEEASHGTIKDLDRTFDGLALGWRRPLTETWRLAVDASYGRSRYQQFSRLFANHRSDRYSELSLAMQIRLADNWSLTPRLTLERNDSSMALNGYRRTQYLVELRKDF